MRWLKQVSRKPMNYCRFVRAILWGALKFIGRHHEKMLGFLFVWGGCFTFILVEPGIGAMCYATGVLFLLLDHAKSQKIEFERQDSHMALVANNLSLQTKCNVLLKGEIDSHTERLRKLAQTAREADVAVLEAVKESASLSRDELRKSEKELRHEIGELSTKTGTTDNYQSRRIDDILTGLVAFDTRLKAVEK